LKTWDVFRVTDCVHVLFSFLPPKSDSHYELRKRHYNRQLIPTNTHLFDNEFIVRSLHKDCCQLSSLAFTVICAQYL